MGVVGWGWGWVYGWVMNNGWEGRGKGVLDTHFLLLLLIWKSADAIAGQDDNSYAKHCAQSLLKPSCYV